MATSPFLLEKEMIKKAIARVVEQEHLTEGEMIEVMNQIMSGEATPAQVGAFITALRMKGETVDEITGAARVMRERATWIRVGRGVLDIDRDDINIDQETILDVVGTGGDCTNTFNVSTTVTFVVSACGVRVAKHGNRSVSSLCGSADVLENWGSTWMSPRSRWSAASMKSASVFSSLLPCTAP